MTKYITANQKLGVEPICTVLQFAPTTYYAAVSRPPSARTQHDEHLKEAIECIHFHPNIGRGVYGASKVWDKLREYGIPVARCTVERLMRELGLRGVVRGKAMRTTITSDISERPEDLVDRQFSALAPNRLWVADLTYVKTHSGWVYVAFVVDVFSRYIVGWQASRSLRTSLALDALEMAMWKRRGENLGELVHHSDRGVQYLAFSYTERLEKAGIAPSVGSRGDSYDNALAESFNGLYKTELIHKDGPWYGLEDVEHATMEYVHWFNNERIHYSIDKMSPAKFEAVYHQRVAEKAPLAVQIDASSENTGAVTPCAAGAEDAMTQITLATVTEEGPERVLAATRLMR